MRKLWLLLLLAVGPAQAQNTTCATRLAGDNSNACASTSFAQQLLSGGFATAESANIIFAGPASGAAAAPTFRTLVPADLASALQTPPPIGLVTPSPAAFTTVSAVSATFVNIATVPLIVGGSGTAGRVLSLQTTSGNGVTDALAILGGNNGATTFGVFDSSGLSVSEIVYAVSGIKTSPITVANLKTCNSTNMGLRAFVTDQSTTIAYHGAVVSGGSFKQGVICDGTSWYQN